MGTIEICFIGLLQKTMTIVGVQYAWFLTEKSESSKTLLGLEIGLTKSSLYLAGNPLFFWREKLNRRKRNAGVSFRRTPNFTNDLWFCHCRLQLS